MNVERAMEELASILDVETDPDTGRICVSRDAAQDWIEENGKDVLFFWERMIIAIELASFYNAQNKDSLDGMDARILAGRVLKSLELGT